MVTARLDPAALLAGPRGRRLCSELLLDGVGSVDDPASLFDALAYTVSTAVYWQAPDDEDRQLARSESHEQLWPVAEAVCATPATAWWSEPMDSHDQHEVRFADSGDFAADAMRVPLASGNDALVRWRSDALAEERHAAGWQEDPAVPITAKWWSTPAHAGLSHTTRTVPGHGPAGLYFVEDSLGWKWARCQAVRPISTPSVFEIHRPQDWGRLVQSYPLVVTYSRRHDWRRATGEDHEWAMPDYLALSNDYDAIHLSVAGYLSTAGRALPAGDHFTVLAGWSPDQTWWLTDRPTNVGDAVRWGHGLGSPLEAWAPS